MLLLVAIPAAQLSHAQMFKVLHTFHGQDGASPVGVLILDSAGNLYGTTGVGGSGNCSGGEGCGTVFKMDKTGKEVWLHKFDSANGAIPYAGLLRDGGNFFGTTLEGGGTNCNPPYGCGTVFKLSEKGQRETVLHRFTGDPDGSSPEAPLVSDQEGNLYGTTPSGGAHALGAVFKVSRTRKETVLYSFTGGSDGCYPYPGVVRDSAGNLFGVATEGGDGFCNSGVGVVFKIDASGGETVLHTFGGADGANPDSVLLFDSQGNLYGTTVNGGSSTGCGNTGCGTIFELSPSSNGTWTESVLYSFCSLSGCTDGESPGDSLVRDSAGNIYGTTYFGGAYSNCTGNGVACGVVFKLDLAGTETVLHSFTGGADGAFPAAGLTSDDHGKFYGTTTNGGATCYIKYTCGVLFRVIP